MASSRTGAKSPLANGTLLSGAEVHQLFAYVKGGQNKDYPSDKKPEGTKQLVVTYSRLIDAAAIVIPGTPPLSQSLLERVTSIVRSAPLTHIKSSSTLGRGLYMTSFYTRDVPDRISKTIPMPGQKMTKEVEDLCMWILQRLETIPSHKELNGQVWKAKDYYKPVTAIIDVIATTPILPRTPPHNGLSSVSQLGKTKDDHDDLTAVLLLGQSRYIEFRPIAHPKDKQPSYFLESGSILYLLGKNMRTYYPWFLEWEPKPIGSTCILTVRFRSTNPVRTIRTDISAPVTNKRKQLKPIITLLRGEELPSYKILNNDQTFTPKQEPPPLDILDSKPTTQVVDDEEEEDSFDPRFIDGTFNLDVETRRALLQQLKQRGTPIDGITIDSLPLKLTMNRGLSELSGYYDAPIRNLPEILAGVYQVHRVVLSLYEDNDVDDDYDNDPYNLLDDNDDHVFDADEVPPLIVLDLHKSSTSSSSTPKFESPSPLFLDSTKSAPKQEYSSSSSSSSSSKPKFEAPSSLFLDSTKSAPKQEYSSSSSSSPSSLEPKPQRRRPQSFTPSEPEQFTFLGVKYSVDRGDC